jgi:hypothetical protein
MLHVVLTKAAERRAKIMQRVNLELGNLIDHSLNDEG